MGGGIIPGLLGRSGIVRMLDKNGDLSIGPGDIADAALRIMRLDADGNGNVTAEDDLPPAHANSENKIPNGVFSSELGFSEKNVHTLTHQDPPEYANSGARGTAGISTYSRSH